MHSPPASAIRSAVRHSCSFYCHSALLSCRCTADTVRVAIHACRQRRSCTFMSLYSHSLAVFFYSYYLHAFTHHLSALLLPLLWQLSDIYNVAEHRVYGHSIVRNVVQVSFATMKCRKSFNSAYCGCSLTFWCITNDTTSCHRRQRMVIASLCWRFGRSMLSYA